MVRRRSRMGSLGMLLLGIIITISGYLVWHEFFGFGAQRIGDYQTEKPITPSSLAEILDGDFTAHGVIYDYRGRVISRFNAEIHGEFKGNSGELRESFSYASGATDKRRWSIQISDDGSNFSAVADDVEGVAIGKLGGDAIQMSYSLKLPERAGGHVLQVNDWLYVMPDGTIVNRSEMRKFGIKAAELFAVFARKQSSKSVKIAAE